MPRLVAVTLALLAIAVESSLATAQSGNSGRPTLEAGTRIRVTAAPPVTAVTGVVVSHTADTLAVRTDYGNTISVPVVQVTRVDVSGGMKTRKLLGASLGLLVGVGIASVAGPSGPLNCLGSASSNCGDQSVSAGGAVVGGLAGALVGTMLGAWPEERWNPVAGTALGGARVGLAPAAGSGVALTASLTF